MADEFEPIPIKIEKEDDDWLVDEPVTSQYVEAKIEREESGEEKKFKCNHPNCKYSTNIRKDFKNHQAIHSDERPHKCDKCVLTFKSKSYLRIHRRKVHYKELGVERKKHKGEIFTCKELDCKYSSHCKRNLKTHAVTHSKERPYKCDKCEKAFKRSGGLKIHLQYHSGESPYQCDECEKVCKTKGELTSHKFTHTNEKLKCEEPDCEYATFIKCSLKAHAAFHSKERPFKCDKCDKSFKSTNCLKNHMRLHSTETPFQCDKCDRAFKVKGSLAQHKLIHRPKDEWHKCDVCDYTTSMRSRLRNHQFTHTDVKPIKCDLCEFSFKNKVCLDSHKRYVHSNGEKPFKCDKCDYRTRYIQCLKEHLIIHVEPNTLKFENCDYPNCGYSTPIKGKLKIHKRRIHERLKHFKCDECERATFTTLWSLKVHSFSHAKIKPIKCERCRYSCATNGILRRHLSSKHMNEKEHKCEECGGSYDTEKDLKNHKLRHDEANRKFKCNLCPFRTFKKVYLSNHVSILHNNKKSFKCETCQRSFNSRSQLKTHSFVHSKTKIFICHQCDYRTHCPRNLKCHLLSHRVSNEKSRKICDQCGLILRDELDSRTHQDAHRGCFVPLRNIIMKPIKIELEDFIKREII